MHEIECRDCNDSGFKVGTYELCPCTTGSNEYASDATPSISHEFTPTLSPIDGAPTRICGIRIGNVMCAKRKEEHHVA